MGIIGIHHITLLSSDAGRALDFYTRVLGLELLRRTGSDGGGGGDCVYLGSREGRLLVRLIERPGLAAGQEGVGGTHHFALLVETPGLLRRWKRWLTGQGVAVTGPLDRHYFESIYLRDPDGTVIEMATRGPGWARDEVPERIGAEHRPPPPDMLKENRDAARIQADTWPEPVPEITAEMRFRQMHHVTAIGDDIERTHAFVHGGLGLRRVKRTSNFDRPDSFHWYWGVGEGEPGTVVTYFERRGAAPVRHGVGQASHYTLSVADGAALAAVRRRLETAGFEVSEVEDHAHFQSVRTRDPHGQVVEIATAAPHFAPGEAEDEP